MRRYGSLININPSSKNHLRFQKKKSENCQRKENRFSRIFVITNFFCFLLNSVYKVVLVTREL